MRFTCIICGLGAVLLQTDAFLPQTSVFRVRSRHSSFSMSDESSKGFSKQKTAPIAPAKVKSRPQNAAAPRAPPTNNLEPREETEDQQEARRELARMEAEKALKTQATARRVADIREAQRITQVDKNAGIIPQRVSDRMLNRMIPFFVLPVVSGIGVFVFFFVLAKKYDTSFQPGMVALATQLPFAISLVGITYAILSASWDPEVEGSPLGLVELGNNLSAILEGLRRTSERQELDEQEEKQRDRKMNRAQRRQAEEDSEANDD